jgi:PadR family transcriptional regulator
MWYSHRRATVPNRDKLELVQGTLDLMVLRTLATLGAQHGYGIARRIEQVSGDAILINQGTIYASLVRLQHRRLIASAWGASENGRRAKFYAITAKGRRQLADGEDKWARITAVMRRVRGM